MDKLWGIMPNFDSKKCIEALGRYTSAVLESLNARIQMAHESATGSLQGIDWEKRGRAQEEETESIEKFLQEECGFDLEHDDVKRRELYASEQLVDQLVELSDAMKINNYADRGEGIVPLPDVPGGDKIFPEPTEPDVMHG